MRIFISYGHDCTEFIDRVKESLEKQGHSVWVDVSCICGGSDWRNAIAEGVIASQAVLFFMSSHSLRKESVCNDEISISIACNRRIVRPVLLEKNIENLIPPTISRIQYIDYSDWHEFINDQTEYEKRINELLDVLKQLEEDPYDSQMDILRTVLRPSISNNHYLMEKGKTLFEREWITNQLKEWINQNQKSPILVVGFPGSGKSSYCASHYYSSSAIVAMIFFEWGKSQHNDPNFVVRNIAYQIATKVTTYRNRLLWIISSNQGGISSYSVAELFDLLITEPLMYEIDGQHESLVIVLDGLDEASGGKDNPIAELISSRISRLPGYLSFVITTRKDNNVLRYYSGANILELSPRDKNIKNDIYKYLNNRVHGYLDDALLKNRIVDHITEICEGSFLLAYLISEGIQQGTLSVTNNKVIPTSIYSTYFQWMSRLVSQSEFESDYYDTFAILCSLNRPIPNRLLKSFVGWNSRELNGFIRTFNSFLNEVTNSFGQKCIELFHQSFKEWMTNDDYADVYYVGMDDGIDKLSNESCRAFFNSDYKEYDVIEFWKYVSMNESDKYKLQLANSDVFLNEIINLLKRCIADQQLFFSSEEVWEIVDEVCTIRESSDFTDKIKYIDLPIEKARYYSSSQDYYNVDLLLDEHLDYILNNAECEQKLDCLYMLATASDMLGKRNKAVRLFENLLVLSESTENSKYVKRALVGLAWNNHFSDVGKLKTIVDKLNNVAEDEMTLQLLLARALLTQGELEEALMLFVRYMENPPHDLWGYSVMSSRNQMMLIESLPACYDNLEYELGIEYGNKIYAHLSGLNSLPECYCASWLSMNYLMDGQYELADKYLDIAETINRENNSLSKSNWIAMHLKSVRAFYYGEIGDYESSFECHKNVVCMAEECSDPWVIGDACFEIIKLSIMYNSIISNDINLYVNKLRDISKSSGLPHLIIKSKLADAFYEKIESPIDYREYVHEILHKEYASCDKITIIYLCYCLINPVNMLIGEELKELMINEIKYIYNKNNNECFLKRKFIIRIMEDMRIEL